MISLSIKGRTFDLMWDDDNNESAACLRCALKDWVCQMKPASSLVPLCATIVEEPDTFFVERLVDSEDSDVSSDFVSQFDPYADAL